MTTDTDQANQRLQLGVMNVFTCEHPYRTDKQLCLISKDCGLWIFSKKKNDSDKLQRLVEGLLQFLQDTSEKLVQSYGEKAPLLHILSGLSKTMKQLLEDLKKEKDTRDSLEKRFTTALENALRDAKISRWPGISTKLKDQLAYFEQHIETKIARDTLQELVELLMQFLKDKRDQLAQSHGEKATLLPILSKLSNTMKELLEDLKKDKGKSDALEKRFEAALKTALNGAQIQIWPLRSTKLEDEQAYFEQQINTKIANTPTPRPQPPIPAPEGPPSSRLPPIIDNRTQ